MLSCKWYDFTSITRKYLFYPGENEESKPLAAMECKDCVSDAAVINFKKYIWQKPGFIYRNQRGW